MKAVEAAIEYYIQKYRLYEVRSNGGKGTPIESKIARRLSRLRRYLSEDDNAGGMEITRQIDTQVADDRPTTIPHNADFEI